jgi:glycosyltransferase involved in cell wall biosynthesis
MNILFVDQYTEPGGAQLCLMDLLPAVKRRGWHPFLVAPGSGELAKWCRDSQIPIHALPLRPCSNGTKTAMDFLRYSFDVPRMRAVIERLIQRHAIDVIYVNGPRPLPAVAGLSWLPVIFHAHSDIGAGYIRKLTAHSVRRAKASVIATSKFVARVWPDARVIHNGIPDLWLGPRSFGDRVARIGILGRIIPEKGHLDFVRAARLSDEAARFYIYGAALIPVPGYDAAVRAEAENLPVEFCGWTNDIAAALHDIDILAVPSGAREAATRVIMEAFSAGTPVVAYRSGGIPELVEDGRTGILTESPDAEALARAVRLLITDPAKMERLSIAGRREWESRFRLETFQQNACDFIENAAGRATSASRCRSPVAARAYDEPRDAQETVSR